MKICKYSEVESEIKELFKKGGLIPVIGAGFTKGAKAQKGKVPSGEELCDYMRKIIIKRGDYDTNDVNSIKIMKFSEIAELYEEEVKRKERKNFFRANFSNVEINKIKKEFLKCSWPYVYTLNIDDGIENNSKYNKVIVPNRIVDDTVYNQYNCLIKLHGDVEEFLKYDDSELIFSQKSYIESLGKNKSLMTRLKYDMQLQNIVYIGCSLQDEMDLLINLDGVDFGGGLRFCFYFTNRIPSKIQQIQLKKFCITHVVVFDDFEEMYMKIVDTYKNSTKLEESDLNKLIAKEVNVSTNEKYEYNKKYIFWGHRLIDDKGNINLPYIFIERSITSKIINLMFKKTITIMQGGAFSGKTYILTNVAKKIKNRTVYILQSRYRFNEDAFEKIIKRDRSVLLIDEYSLNEEQTEYIFKNISEIKKRGINILIVLSKKSNYSNDKIKLQFMNDDINIDEINNTVKVPNRFNEKEMRDINEKLNRCNLGTFADKTILDNVLSIADELKENHKFSNLLPKTSSRKEIAALIVLAIKGKISTYECTRLNLYAEMLEQEKRLYPLISYENTMSFEKSNADNSKDKFVVNASFWLRLSLTKFAMCRDFSIIADSYRYIVEKIIMYYGKPNVDYGENKFYRDFILFDNINIIFGLKNKNSLELIRLIYEGLNDILASEPSYKHQKSKCYIRLSQIPSDNEHKIKYLKEAYKLASGAIMIYDKRYNDTSNRKVNISLQHAIYTRAVIACHMCGIYEYKNDNWNDLAIDFTYEAFKSPYNEYKYAQDDLMNYGNAISKMIANLSLKNIKEKEKMEFLIETSQK